MTIEERLTKIKSRIEEAKTEKATLEGRITEQLERLKEFGCKTVAEAESKIKTLTKETERLEKELAKSLTEFEEKYGSD